MRTLPPWGSPIYNIILFLRTKCKSKEGSDKEKNRTLRPFFLHTCPVQRIPPGHELAADAAHLRLVGGRGAVCNANDVIPALWAVAAAYTASSHTAQAAGSAPPRRLMHSKNTSGWLLCSTPRASTMKEKYCAMPSRVSTVRHCSAGVGADAHACALGLQLCQHRAHAGFQLHGLVQFGDHLAHHGKIAFLGQRQAVLPDQILCALLHSHVQQCGAQIPRGVRP